MLTNQYRTSPAGKNKNNTVNITGIIFIIFCYFSESFGEVFGRFLEGFGEVWGPKMGKLGSKKRLKIELRFLRHLGRVWGGSWEGLGRVLGGFGEGFGVSWASLGALFDLFL